MSAVIIRSEGFQIRDSNCSSNRNCALTMTTTVVAVATITKSPCAAAPHICPRSMPGPGLRGQSIAPTAQARQASPPGPAALRVSRSFTWAADRRSTLFQRCSSLERAGNGELPPCLGRKTFARSPSQEKDVNIKYFITRICIRNQNKEGGGS